MFNIRACGIAAAAAFVVSLLMGLIAQASFPAFIVRPIVFALVFFILAALINILISHYLPELLDGGSHSSTAQGEKLFSMPGEHINISEDDMPDSGIIAGNVPALSAAVAEDADGNLGDIASLDDEPAGEAAPAFESAFKPEGGSSGGFSPLPLETTAYKTKDGGAEGLDQKAGDGYTTAGGAGDFSAGLDAFTGGESFDAAPAKKRGGTPVSGGGGSGATDILPDLDGMAKAFSSDSGSIDTGETDSYTGSMVKKSSSRNKGQEMSWDFNPKDMAQGIRTKISKEG